MMKSTQRLSIVCEDKLELGLTIGFSERNKTPREEKAKDARRDQRQQFMHGVRVVSGTRCVQLGVLSTNERSGGS